jgi:hypothetical protein
MQNFSIEKHIQNQPHPWGRGGPPILFYPKPFSFFDLKPHAKFRNPTITPSGRKNCVGGGWFEGVFSVSFGPNPPNHDFCLRLGQGGTKGAAVAMPLPGNFSEKNLLAGNFT